MTAMASTGSPTALDSARRSADLVRLGDLGGAAVDVLVVGLGVTGAGVALDAVTRGLSVVAVDAHDLAFGTSRWSSKLVHGGLRYLARGELGIAHESAVERGLLMTRTAPHLVRTLRTMLPLTGDVPRGAERLARAGFVGGDLLRVVARTPVSVLPKPRRLDRAASVAACPPVRRTDLRGALIGYDGQLEDDARLVTALARTAAGYGARVLTHVRADRVTATGARLTDALTGESLDLRARVVVNAAGVWAGEVAPGLRLRPSRGTHLVLTPGTLPGLWVALTAPVPGERDRFVFALPQPDGRVYVGLTDEPVEGGAVPEVPEPTEDEVTFLVETISRVLEVPLGRTDVAAAFSGLRPLLRSEGRTADLSRRHAVLAPDDGPVTVVGGKLTTYRRMAEDAVDAAASRIQAAGPCRTRGLPLVGALGPTAGFPERLVRRYGAEAAAVLDDARVATGLSDADLLAPLTDGVPTCLAELVWGVTHEGALTVADLLDRRTRVGLVAHDRSAALDAARLALSAGTRR